MIGTSYEGRTKGGGGGGEQLVSGPSVDRRHRREGGKDVRNRESCRFQSWPERSQTLQQSEERSCLRRRKEMGRTDLSEKILSVHHRENRLLLDWQTGRFVKLMDADELSLSLCRYALGVVSSCLILSAKRLSRSREANLTCEGSEVEIHLEEKRVLSLAVERRRKNIEDEGHVKGCRRKSPNDCLDSLPFSLFPFPFSTCNRLSLSSCTTCSYGCRRSSNSS
jgi:hypothetical protein